MALFRPLLAKSALMKTFSSNIRCFWEPHRKGDSKYVKKDDRTFIQKVVQGTKLLKGEFQLFSDEAIEALRADPKMYEPGDTDIIWNFNSVDELNKWIVTSDKDNQDGFSNSQFELSKSKKGLFRGYLDMTTPKDGVTYKSGYCNISSQKVRKSFFREDYLNWTMFTHLVMNVRGDGRSYMVNIMTTGTFDLSWNDMFSFVLYTRGGPYWQRVKIPFSKFFMSSKGKIQDKQCPIPLHMISNLGITCSDVPGPFQLEIDYVGVHFDPSHKEEFAYEMYQTNNYNLY